MRIVHLTSTFLPNIGGAEIDVHNLAIQQHKAGHELTVITKPHSWRELRKELPYRLLPLLPQTYSLRTLRGLGLRRWLLSRQLAFYQRIYQFDIWNLHSAYPLGVLAAPFFRSNKIPSVMTSHGEDIQIHPGLNYGFRLNPDINREVSESLPLYSSFIAISNSISEEYLGMGITPDRIQVIHNGIDAARIKSIPSQAQEIRKKMGLPLDRKIFLTVGRNHRKKGYGLIPEIIKHLLESRTDIFWLIVGRECEEVADKAIELGVNDYLKIVSEIGFQKSLGKNSQLHIPSDEMVQSYKAADLFVFPSFIEGCPRVHLEAMAAGLPVITTNAPGCRDVIQDGITGLLSPAGDTRKMAINILKLLSNPAVAEEMGRNGQKEAQDIEWSKVAMRYCSVYEKAILHHGADTA
jgi:glycosyltransferase involved in cell wall biosynthesis